MSATDLIRSPRLGIPLYRVVDVHGGELFVEFLNDRTGVTEIVNVDRLVMHLLSGRLAREKEMIYSPGSRIPIGAYVHDEMDKVYIEVKNKKQKERICISQYVGMLLELKALKTKAVS